MRDWAQPMLWTHGHPIIIAGQYGKGRVVWTGMNLVAHANDKNNEEVRLLHNLVAWLVAEKGTGDYPVTVTRDHPDRVEFRMDVPAGKKVALYWREAYYPAWHAYLKTADGARQELPIYRAGPGFMLMPIEAASGRVSVELVWKTPLIERTAALVSLLTAIGLFAGVVSPTLWPSLLGRLRRPRERTRPQGRVAWLADLTTIQDAQPESDALHAADEADAASAERHPGASSPGDVGDEVGSGEDLA